MGGEGGRGEESEKASVPIERGTLERQESGLGISGNSVRAPITTVSIYRAYALAIVPTIDRFVRPLINQIRTGRIEREGGPRARWCVEGFIFPAGNPTHSECSLVETLITERSFRAGRLIYPGARSARVIRKERERASAAAREPRLNDRRGKRFQDIGARHFGLFHYRKTDRLGRKRDARAARGGTFCRFPANSVARQNR